MSIFDIEPTMESVAEINAELNESTYKLTTSLYIADLLLEQRAQTGEDIEALMEATRDGFFKKITNAFKKSWDKIKLFFRNLLKKVEEIISGGKRFINKYEKDIRDLANNKDVKWIEFTPYHNSERILDFVKHNPDIIEDIIYMFEGNSLDNTKVHIISDTLEAKLTSCVAYDCTTYDEAKAYIQKLVNPNKYTASQSDDDKRNLEKMFVDNMIDTIKDYINTGRREINNKVKILNKLYSQTINTINNVWAHSELMSNNPESIKDHNRFRSEVIEINRGISFAYWISTQASTVYSNLYKHCLSTLKEFMTANKELIDK